MKGRHLFSVLCLAVLSLFWAAGTVSAQEQETAVRERRGAREGREMTEEMRERMQEARERIQRGERGERGERQAGAALGQLRTERIRRALEVTDEEWQALEPLVNRVMDLNTQAALRGAAMRRPGTEEAEPGAVQKARAELQAALDEPEATPATVSARLASLREAQRAALEERDTARAELRELLTAHQEAQLVLMGVLE